MGFHCPVTGSTSLLLLQVLASSALFRTFQYGGSAKTVGSGSRQELKLRIAAPQFGIDRRDDNLQFADQVRIHVRRGQSVRGPSRAAGRVDTVPLDIGCSETFKPGKASTNAVVLNGDARDQPIEIHDVVGDVRQGFEAALESTPPTDELDVASSVSAATETSTAVSTVLTLSVKFKRSLSAFPSCTSVYVFV